MQKERLRNIISVISTLISFFKKDEINFARLDLPKVFYETVDKETLKTGAEIIKSVFPQKFPKMLETNYAFFWFYCLELSCNLEKEEKEQLLKYLSQLYTYIHINSIVRKHVRYNFDHNIWWEAVQKSRSRYLKKGGLNYLVDIISENTFQRLISGPYSIYCSNKVYYVKSYYMMRHKISQIFKPVLEVYYALIEIKKRHTTVSDKLSGADITETSTVRSFLIWFDEIIENENLLEKIKNKKCFKVTYQFLSYMKNLQVNEKEIIIKQSLRKVVEEDFWKEEKSLVEFYQKYNIEVPFKNFVLCLVETINEIYNIYAKYLHQKKFEDLILLYFLQEI